MNHVAVMIVILNQANELMRTGLVTESSETTSQMKGFHNNIIHEHRYQNIRLFLAAP